MTNINFKHQGAPLLKEATILDDAVRVDGREHAKDDLHFDVPISGTVYGAALNYKGSYEQLEGEMDEAPYKAPPKAPILYIKPVNTHIANKVPVPMPEAHEVLSAGAALAVIIGKTATKVSRENALEHVAGYTIVNDVSIPHESVYRPAYKEKARDGFCPVGPWIVESEEIKDPNNLNISVYVNGELKVENNTSNLIRPVEELLVEVTDFMTLHEGDVLLTGVPENMPLIKVGDTVKVEIEGIGTLENQVAYENEIVGGRIYETRKSSI